MNHISESELNHMHIPNAANCRHALVYFSTDLRNIAVKIIT